MSKAQGCRLGFDTVLAQHGIFGKAAEAGAAHDRIAKAQTFNPLADGHDLSGQLHTDAKGQGRFELIFAARHQQIGEVDRCGLDLDQDFTRAGLWHSNLLDRHAAIVGLKR